MGSCQVFTEMMLFECCENVIRELYHIQPETGKNCQKKDDSREIWPQKPVFLMNLLAFIFFYSRMHVH